MFPRMSPEIERASHGKALERLVAGFRRRAIGIGAIRGGLAFLAGFSIALSIAGALVGPIVSAPLAFLAWAVVLFVGALFAIASSRGATELKKDRAVRLVARVDETLGHEARSALDLHQSPDRSTSAALASAHLARVLEGMRSARPEQAIPLWPSISRPLVLFVAGASLLGGALATDGRASAGVMALGRAPFHVDLGYATGEVVREYVVDVVPPTYRDEPTRRGVRTPHLEVLAGSTVRFEIEPRIDASAAVLRVGQRRVDLSRQPSGRFRGTSVIDEGGPVVVRIRTRRGEWIEDLRGRSIRAIPDLLPDVALEAIQGESSSERVVLRWAARDDHGVAEVRLVTEVEGFPPSRRALSEETGSQRSKRGLESIALRELGAEPGDSVSLVLEARDHKPPPESRFVRSESVIVTLPSPETERQRHLSFLEESLVRTLDALADRLEAPRTNPLDNKRERRVIHSTALVPPSIDRAIEGVSGSDAPLLRRYLHELRTAYERETIELAKKSPSPRVLTKQEVAIVGSLEKGALLLDDLRAKARLDDFQEVALELEALRREIASLLAEYARTRDPETKHALGRAIHRAKKKLEALRARMAESGSDVPREFVNAGEESQRESEKTLERLEAALESDSLDDAKASLLELERELHAMAEAFGKGQSEVADSRFGPRQRALAEAIERVRGFEAEEVELAREHAEIRRALAERALGSLGETAKIGERESVDTALKRALRAIDAMGDLPTGATEEDVITRITGRVHDVREALAQGDLGEASKMAREAHHDAFALERDLSLRATMFPGRAGEVRKAAETAERAAEAVSRLSMEVERAIPDLDAHLRARDVRDLERLAARHRALERAAAEVVTSLAEGPDGVPLSEEGASELRRAVGLVERGSRASAEHDAVTASESASRAAEALRRTRELLEEHQRNPSSSQGGGGRASGMSSSDKVVIPGREDRPESDRRRRIRDGLREDAPEDYRDSVKRYFEALLR
jgi:hypothetical protein